MARNFIEKWRKFKSNLMIVAVFQICLLDGGDYDYEVLHNMDDDQTVCAGFSNGVNNEGESCKYL